MIECPYCEHEQDNPDDFDYSAIVFSWECDKCGKKYLVTPEYSVDFYTTKKP